MLWSCTTPREIMHDHWTWTHPSTGFKSYLALKFSTNYNTVHTWASSLQIASEVRNLLSYECVKSTYKINRSRNCHILHEFHNVQKENKKNILLRKLRIYSLYFTLQIKFCPPTRSHQGGLNHVCLEFYGPGLY